MGHTIKVIVVPNARTYQIVHDRWRDCIKVYVKSKAHEGEANRDLISFLSRHLKRPRIVSGHKSKIKAIHVENEEEEVAEILKSLNADI